jgi:type IV pilus assembly protein PilV
MTAAIQLRKPQSGAYLLEALIGILIFSFGILGIVGLQAQAIRFTNDSEFRAEAVYLANSLISQMWTDDRAQLKTNYDSTVGGPKYIAFKNQVTNAFQGADVLDPEVLVDDAALPPAPTKTSSVVRVTISWRLPGEPANLTHNYTTTGVVGQN